MNSQIFQTSVIILAFAVVGWSAYTFAKWLKAKSDKRKQENNIDFIKKNSWLEISKGRGYGRNKFNLVTLNKNKKVKRKISEFEYKIYKDLGIESKGHAAKTYDRRTRTAFIR